LEKKLANELHSRQVPAIRWLQLLTSSRVERIRRYEYLERAAARLKIVVPVTLLIIFLLLYLNFRSIAETMIVMLSLPFALAAVSG
jgi:Cu/Ag efflux pump CusA